ncbi:molybdopterin synthase sulfur carrier subunit [Algoriphagus boseongensis]|uniref:Molybdopterin synthase sulfur carrier subunit n=1 Tax=Algoriphagus boseongensis TaxID=1442587 RepID=A0A4V3D2L6_9BACT|nr:MoaD/ThiS family protein [Algoriphagus boseongensis]TDQ19437.1 molybdopterin synthase sulfur carrier subunit [Algoriphagus boseongensis]
MSQTIQIKAFGMIAEKIGSSDLSLDNPGTLKELRAQLESQFPDLVGVKFSFALNKKMQLADSEIPAGAEVALLPPFSGG